MDKCQNVWFFESVGVYFLNYVLVKFNQSVSCMLICLFLFWRPLRSIGKGKIDKTETIRMNREKDLSDISPSEIGQSRRDSFEPIDYNNSDFNKDYYPRKHRSTVNHSGYNPSEEHIRHDTRVQYEDHKDKLE